MVDVQPEVDDTTAMELHRRFAQNGSPLSPTPTQQRLQIGRHTLRTHPVPGDADAVWRLPLLSKDGTAGQVDIASPAPDVWRLRTGDSDIEVNVSDRADVRVCIGGPLNLYLLVSAVGNVLAMDGWAAIHGSAFSDPEGQATVAIGPSGAGKSCRVLLALREGWLPVAEDTVWLHVATRTLCSTEDGIRLRSEALDLLAPEHRAQVLPEPDGKFRLALSALGQTTVRQARPTALEVLLGLPPSGPSPSFPGPGAPGRAWQVARHVWSAFGTPFLPDARRCLEAAAAVLVSLPTVALHRAPSGTLYPV